MSEARLLCALADIAEPGSRGFAVETGDGTLEIFVVRADGQIHGYVNVCPHAGTPLDWKPDQFLSPDRRAIQCATHGARFEIATGACIFGPCLGSRLQPVKAYTQDDNIFLETTTWNVA